MVNGIYHLQILFGERILWIYELNIQILLHCITYAILQCLQQHRSLDGLAIGVMTERSGCVIQ